MVNITNEKQKMVIVKSLIFISLGEIFSKSHVHYVTFILIYYFFYQQILIYCDNVLAEIIHWRLRLKLCN